MRHQSECSASAGNYDKTSLVVVSAYVLSVLSSHGPPNFFSAIQKDYTER